MNNKQVKEYLERRRKLMDSLAEVITCHVNSFGYGSMSQLSWDEFSENYRANHCNPSKPVMVVKDEFNNKKVIKDFDINSLDTLFGGTGDDKKE